MSKTLDDLHERMRAKVRMILETPAASEEAREVRLMKLYAAYERYGNDADRIRMVS